MEPATESALARTAHLLRQLGPGDLATRLLQRAVRSLCERGSVTFFVRDLGPEVPDQPLAGFSLRQLRPSDKEGLLHGSQAPWATLLSRFQAGDLCFGALDAQGRAVHTRWVTLTRARIPELDLDFVPGPDAAYFYDGYTRPDARRCGVDAAVRRSIFGVLRALGRRRVYSYVRDDNPEGLRAAGRCQARVGSARYVRLLRSRPWPLGLDAAGLTGLLRQPCPPRPREAVRRAADWRRWFEGWLHEPLAKRSLGCHELPEAGLAAMAGHISATLDLDPARDLVLDLGCDSAMVTRLVAPRCSRLVGVDFVPGMLLDAQRGRGAQAALQASLRLAAADGRSLPFPAATFAKSYCSGVVHTLPSRREGLALILELVRVTRPGGRVLVAAVPDARKRWEARRAAWRQGGGRQRARLLAATVLPGRLKQLARRLAPGLPRAPLTYLQYDLGELQVAIESWGLGCAIVEYPPDFWSRDFRETRANLLITLPPATAAAGPSPAARQPRQAVRG